MGVVCIFVLLLEEFDAIGWSDTGRVAVFEDGTWLSEAVVISEVQLESRLCKSWVVR